MTKINMYSFDKETDAASLASKLDEKRLIGMRDQNLRNLFSGYEGCEHKLENVKTIRGVTFINDSRSANVNSVWFALESMTRPTVWIMNISDIDLIEEDLLESIDNKVKKIVIQGVYSSEIIDFFTGLQKEVFFAMNLEDAVRSAFYACEEGDVVLFSPGVPSGGMYHTYRERGLKFKNAVSQL